MFPFTHHLLLGFYLLLLFSVKFSASLMCYQCASTTDTSDCYNDYEGFLNASQGIKTNYPYAKNCTSSKPTWDRCMIESAKTDGKVTLYHRGCTDGKNFPDKLDDPRFLHLKPNNVTTCGLNNEVGMFVCYTFCVTDFCNGPQFEAKPPCNATEYGETCGAPVTPRELLWYTTTITIAVINISRSFK